MITIKITDRSIRMNGHACGKSPDGIDRWSFYGEK